MSLEEMVLAQMFESEALLNVLEGKDFPSRAEILREVQWLRERAVKAH